MASTWSCEGGRALVVGHSPTNEGAVLGLAGEIVEPISKGGGVLVVATPPSAVVGERADCRRWGPCR